MTFWRQTNSGGTNGTTLTAGSGGSADGSTPYDAVSTGTGVTLAFDNTHTLYGAGDLAVKAATSTTASRSDADWTTGISFAVPMYMSACFYFTANPGANTPIMQISVGTTTLMCGVAISTAGKVLGRNSASTAVTTSSASIPLNAWCRIEQQLIVASATVGQFETRLFTDPFSAVPTETNTTTAAQNTGTGTPTQLRFGVVTAIASLGPFWVAYPQSSNTAYPPPPPTVRRWGQMGTANRPALMRAATF